jgi:hypothetical protein
LLLLLLLVLMLLLLLQQHQQLHQQYQQQQQQRIQLSVHVEGGAPAAEGQEIQQTKQPQLRRMFP